MSKNIIHINKKKYAVGLFWQPVASGYSGRNYARALSKTVDKKLNLYTEARAMVGLGAYGFGQYGGMPVAAAEVMNGLSEYSSFLGAFNVDNGVYLIAVRNGIILHDNFYENKDDARQEYQKLSELPDWSALFAPDSWSMPRAVQRSLSKIVSSNPRILLRPISYIRSVLWPLIVLVIFVALILVFFKEPIKQIRGVKKVDIDPELAAEYKRQIEAKNKELDKKYDIQKVEVKPIVLPYNSLPNPQDRAYQCYQAMGFLMQPVVGWNQRTVECNEKYAVTQIIRDYGSIGDFYELASESMKNAFVQEKDEDTLVVSARLPELKTYASQDERDADTIVRDITTLFQMLNTSVTTEIVVDTLTNGVDTVMLNIVEVAAQSKLVPMQFMQIFDGFDGVYMTRCTWNATNRIWNYEVIIYAK